MNVLIVCESSGTVREAFRKLGHNAWSCDTLPADDGSEFHFHERAEDVLCNVSWQWDLLIAHPPCTYLCSSGLHWNHRVPGRQQLTEQALDFVRLLMDAPVPRIAIENPVGCIGTRIRKADQKIQPYEFGHDASKGTCLWLKNLPKLVGTSFVPGRLVDGKPRWANQTDSGQNRLAPSADRWKLRSKTYEGIAQAMAEQWGGKL